MSYREDLGDVLYAWYIVSNEENQFLFHFSGSITDELHAGQTLIGEDNSDDLKAVYLLSTVVTHLVIHVTKVVTVQEAESEPSQRLFLKTGKDI